MPIDYKDYPPDWKEIRTRILERAKDRCEECGVENHVWHNRNGKQVFIVLTIAHLDHDKENHEVTDDRLKALCQKCHSITESLKKYDCYPLTAVRTEFNNRIIKGYYVYEMAKESSYYYFIHLQGRNLIDENHIPAELIKALIPKFNG